MTEYVLRSDYEYRGRQVSSYFAGVSELLIKFTTHRIPCISSGPLDMAKIYPNKTRARQDKTRYGLQTFKVVPRPQ